MVIGLSMTAGASDVLLALLLAQDAVAAGILDSVNDIAASLRNTGKGDSEMLQEPTPGPQPPNPTPESVDSNPFNSFPALYHELADWWPVLSAPEEYAEEAQFYARTLAAASASPIRTVLELGSGGGNNALHMKQHFELTLVDLSPGMLAVSRRLNPDCEHIQGDMRSVRLGFQRRTESASAGVPVALEPGLQRRTESANAEDTPALEPGQFDAVFIQDAIDYMATEADLLQALTTAFVHCRPGGVALFAPDHTRETFMPSTSHGGHDDVHRALRYLEWTWDPDPADSTIITDMVYLLRDETQAVRCVVDRHISGLFSQADWLRLIGEVGFVAEMLPFVHSEIEPGSMHAFLGYKPLE